MANQEYEKYIAHNWQASERIDAELLNHMEKGIASLSGELYAKLGFISGFEAQTQQYIDRINAKLEQLNDLQTAVEQRAAETINNKLIDFNNTVSSLATQASLNNLITAIYGSSGINNGTSDSLKAWIQSELNKLASSTTITNIQNDISDLQAVDNNIQAALGDYYDLTQTTTSNNSVTARLNTLTNNLSNLNNTVFGTSTSGSDKTIVEQIAALNNAIFGSASGGESSGSLIDKIKAVLGRELPDAQNIPASGFLTDSLTAQINEIKGTLGMSGGTSGGTSTLIDDVNNLLNLLYGYDKTIVEQEDPENPSESIQVETFTRKAAPNGELLHLVNAYPTLYDDFYNITVTYQEEQEDPENENQTITVEQTTTGSAKQLLTSVYSQMMDVRASNANLNQTITQYANTIQRSERAYIAAEIETLGENEYLILQRDPTAAVAPNEEAVAEGDYNNNTYILLPKGGGGGAATYDLLSSIVDVVYPESSVIVIGKSCPITFTWRITDENNGLVSVSGNLVVRLGSAVVLSQTIRSNESQTIDLGQYITASGNNQLFTIIITNPAAQTRRLYTTISAYNAVLSSSFNANVIQTGSYIEYSYLASIGSASIAKTLHIEIDGEPITLTGNETLTERPNSIIFDTPAAGDHLMKVWFTAETEGRIITSKPLYYGILCGTSLQTRIASNFIDGTEIQRYNNLVIQYLVVTPNREETEVKFYINDSSTPVYTLNVPPVYQQWSYPVTEIGGPLKITIVANGVTKELNAIVLDDAQIDLSMVTSGLRLFLNAEQRSNNESNPAIWTNSYTDAGAANITATLENFLFYNTIDGWQQDNDGAYFLRLRNQNKVTIPFSIFNSDVIENGMTLEIDFKTQDVADYDTNIIECYEGNSLATSSKNIVLTPQNATLNNTKALTTQYKEEEKITIDFVINPASTESTEPGIANAVGLLYIYINGILSAATPYEGTALSFNDTSSAKIVLGSTECTLDLYSIKYYNRALDYKDIIKNWIYNTGSFEEKLRRYNRNKYDNLTIEEFTKRSPSTPYMVITGGGPLDGANAFMPQQKGSDYKKTVDVYYRDPAHPQYNFDANSYPQNETFTGVCEVQVQGTSSQAYYRKNYKIKLSSFTQDGVFHIKKPSDEYYDITYDEETGVEVSRKLKENVSKEGYKLRENSYPEFTFCIKADVASSESVNNTGLTQIYDSAIRHFTVTPPQFDDPRVRQGVEGYPMVAWYRYYDYDEQNNITATHEILLGKYNFNHDKGTEKVYGLKTALDLDKPVVERCFVVEDGIYDESWEVKNNDAGLVQFEVPGTAASTERENAWFATSTDQNGVTTMNWQNSFESRFPDQDDEGIALITDKNSTYLQKRLAGLRQMVEWVNDTVEWTDASKTAITAASADAFKANFSKYFNLNAIMFFYLFTELFLMVDNRAKNMFWTRYQIREGKRPKTTTYTNADNNVIVNLETTPNLAPDGNNYYGWFTFPYDFDTALGINNKGVNVYDYHWESLDITGPDNSAIFGGQYSKLWVAFRQVYKTEIAAFYPQMTNYINYNVVESLFEQNQSIWSETIVNEDMIVKYINWKSADGYNMLLGLKDMQRKWWLYNRFKYFNSKFAIERGTDNINIRIHVNNANIPVQVYADSYVSVNVSANGTPIPVRVRRGETGIITVGSNNASETDSSGIETYISPASALKSIQNLSTFKLSSIDVSKAIRLQSLQIGTPDITNKNTRLRAVSVTPAEGYTSLLRHIDLRNCENCSILTDANGVPITTNPMLDVSGCLFLNSIYLGGTKLHGVNLPNGGVLKTIQYPTSIKDIIIINQPYLTNLIIGDALPVNEIPDNESNLVPRFTGVNDYSNVTALYLDNVKQINSLEIVETMASNLGNEQVYYLYLADIDWTMTTTEFLALAEKILQMKGFNGTQTSNDAAPYLSGTLHLTTRPTTEEIEYIGQNFNNLKLYYRDEDNNDHEYYTVTFYDPYGAIIDGRTQYVAEGDSASFNSAEFFTEEYLLQYNQTVNPDWAWGAETRYAFKEWDVSFTNVQNDLNIHPIMATQYRMDFVLQTANVNIDETIQTYLFENQEIQAIGVPSFERNYYLYVGGDKWTLDSNRIHDSLPEDTREQISEQTFKAAYVETWYAIYSKTPQTYYINIYTTDEYGEKAGEPLNPAQSIKRNVLSGGGYDTRITANDSDINTYINKAINLEIPIYKHKANGELEEITDKTNYKYLGIKPFLTNTGISVTGNMDLLLTFYHTQDIFTNYFLNKLDTCNLGSSITKIPPYAFNHNTNLTKLISSVNEVGAYSFLNFTQPLRDAQSNQPKHRIFIFNNSGDIVFGSNAFQYLDYGLIIFRGSGKIIINTSAFNQLTNCRIIADSTDEPIQLAQGADIYGGGFSSFTNAGTNNILYVTSTAKNKYPTTGDSNPNRVPTGLITSARASIVSLDEAAADYQALLEEAGI